MKQPRVRVRPMVAVVIGSLLVAAFAISSDPASSATCQRWVAQPVNPGVESVLYGVDTGGPCNAYVVGYYIDAAGKRWSLLEHWDGEDWVVEPGASIEGGTLYDVLITSRNTGWAVGSVAVPDSTTFGRLILKWNGSSWKRMSAGQETYDLVELRALSTVGKNGVWAVGRHYDAGAGGDRAITLRWNGSSWSERPIKYDKNNSPGRALFDVQAISSSSALAVGDGLTHPLFLRWNGKEWKPRDWGSLTLNPPISPSLVHLNSIRGTGTGDAWAVGYTGSSDSPHTLAAHWNGSSWKKYDTPSGVLTAVNPGCCRMWAVGYHEVMDNDGVRHRRTLVLFWDDRHKQWVTQNSLNISSGDNQLLAIDGRVTSAWAVGSFDQGSPQPMALPCC